LCDSLALRRENQMKRFIEGVDRDQITLFPEQLEDWIGDDSPLLSGLVFVDKAHGDDSSVFRAICRRSGHEKGSTPCGITIAFFTG